MIKLWACWASCAVLGRMREADDIMRVFGDGIRAAARLLQERFPIPSKPIWRGMLLEQDVTSPLQPQEMQTFISFSEEREVACWFADPRSIMSEYVVQMHPERAHGYLAYLESPADVLYHHSWTKLLHVPSGQLKWNMDTQKEVIVAPRPIEIVRYVPILDVKYLDAKYCWPPALR